MFAAACKQRSEEAASNAAKLCSTQIFHVNTNITCLTACDVAKQTSMTTISVPFYTYVSDKLKALKRIAKQRRLFFSSQDALNDSLIALDSGKKELVYLNNNSRPASYSVISLQQLAECSITKDYNSINAGELGKSKLQSFLNSMFLNLQFNNGSAPVKIPLYLAQKGSTEDVEKLEAKSNKWQAIICNLLPRQQAVRA